MARIKQKPDSITLHATRYSQSCKNGYGEVIDRGIYDPHFRPEDATDPKKLPVYPKPEKIPQSVLLQGMIQANKENLKEYNRRAMQAQQELHEAEQESLVIENSDIAYGKNRKRRARPETFVPEEIDDELSEASTEIQEPTTKHTNTRKARRSRASSESFVPDEDGDQTSDASEDSEEPAPKFAKSKTASVSATKSTKACLEVIKSKLPSYAILSETESPESRNTQEDTPLEDTNCDAAPSSQPALTEENLAAFAGNTIQSGRTPPRPGSSAFSELTSFDDIPTAHPALTEQNLSNFTGILPPSRRSPLRPGSSAISDLTFSGDISATHIESESNAIPKSMLEISTEEFLHELPKSIASDRAEVQQMSDQSAVEGIAATESSTLIIKADTEAKDFEAMTHLVSDPSSAKSNVAAELPECVRPTYQDNFTDFPPPSAPVKPHMSLKIVCKVLPNSLHGANLDRFLDAGWTSADMFNSCGLKVQYLISALAINPMEHFQPRLARRAAERAGSSHGAVSGVAQRAAVVNQSTILSSNTIAPKSDQSTGAEENQSNQGHNSDLSGEFYGDQTTTKASMTQQKSSRVSGYDHVHSPRSEIEGIEYAKQSPKRNDEIYARDWDQHQKRAQYRETAQERFDDHLAQKSRSAHKQRRAARYRPCGNLDSSQR